MGKILVAPAIGPLRTFQLRRLMSAFVGGKANIAWEICTLLTQSRHVPGQHPLPPRPNRLGVEPESSEPSAITVRLTPKSRLVSGECLSCQGVGTRSRLWKPYRRLL